MTTQNIAHPAAFADYVTRARKWAKMGWDAEGILCHLGNPVFLILGLKDTDMVLRADFHGSDDYQGKRCGEYCAFTTRYNDVGAEVIADIIADVVPYSPAQRERIEAARVQRCEDADARAFERNAYGR